MGNTSFILASIGVFLVVILLLVIILLVAKKYLSPSGNVNIEINGDKTINVPQGSSLMTTLNENGILKTGSRYRKRSLATAACG